MCFIDRFGHIDTDKILMCRKRSRTILRIFFSFHTLDHSCPARGGRVHGWESELAWVGDSLNRTNEIHCKFLQLSWKIPDRHSMVKDTDHIFKIFQI